MKLYLLANLGDVDYDSFDGFVVAASSEEEARSFANERPSDEGAIWQNEEKSSCSLIASSVAEGVAKGIILASYNAG
jgi:hypothetical protein